MSELTENTPEAASKPETMNDGGTESDTTLAQSRLDRQQGPQSQSPGAESEITVATLSKNPESPHNSLKLCWISPSTDPKKYKVEIFKHDDTKLNSIKIKHPQQNALIDNLDPTTEYYCTVHAKYPDGRKSTPARSNYEKTADLPNELFQARKVGMSKNDKIPSRKISVKWKKPKYRGNELGIDDYKVYLTYGNNKKTEVQDINGKCECTFKCLKSNTAHTAHIISLSKEGEERASTSSTSPLTTDTAKRRPGFRIQTEGKVTVTKCEALPENEPRTAMLEWKLPDLGIDKYNYELDAIQVFVASADPKKTECQVVEQCKIKPISVKLGNIYTFTIDCTYNDIDGSKTIHVTETKQLKTTVQCPIIEGVNFDGKIVVTWTKAQGAVKHQLKILCSNSEIWSTATLPHNKHTIDIEETLKDYYGKMCTFQLEAIGANGTTEVTKKEILFGEPSAASNVVAIGRKRSVIVTWEVPAREPDGYLVELFESAHKDPYGNFKYEDSFTTTHTFNDLKSSTKYFCKVRPFFNMDRENKHATVSNTVETEKKSINLMESRTEFGKATNPDHKFISEDEVLLSWHSPIVGPNFKVIEFSIKLDEHTFLWTKKNLLTKKLDPSILEVSSKEISNGSTYTFTITSVLQNLDTRKHENKETKFTFTKKPSPTTIKDCICKDGLVIFSWEPVNGATRYELQVMDQDQQNHLVKKQETTVSKYNIGCSVELQLDDNLRIGCFCLTKVTTYADNETSQSDSKLHFIGGSKVVKNVTATPNKADLYRSVNIAFDRPHEEAAEHQYKVVAIPSEGGRKMKIINSTRLTFQYLKKGCSYHFLVFAKWGDEWSEGSRSNTITTHGNVDTPLLNVGTLNHGDINLQGASVHGKTALNVYMDADIGKVLSLRHILEERNGKDRVTLTWQAPNFGAKTSDYKVELYRIKIFKNKKKVQCTDIEKKEYTADFQWGEMYEASIYTLYEHIDSSQYLMSSAMTHKIFTTPCRPKFVKTDANDEKLQLEWSSVKGAESYMLDIYVDGNQYLEKELAVEETSFMRPFDKTLGYGKTCYAVLKVFGYARQTANESKTETFLIGGEYAPTKVVATSEGVDDPSSQVKVSWMRPEKEPHNYDIEVWTKRTTLYSKKVENTGKDEFLISDLKTGTKYYFKVIANHANNKNIIGCFSNMVETNSAPPQVQNVKLHHGKNRATSIEVYWDEVDKEKNSEDIDYCITLIKSKGHGEISVVVPSGPYIFNLLEMHTSYHVKVKACNKYGPGRYSESVPICTEVGTPKNVKLAPDTSMPDSKLVLSFSQAEGNDLHYWAELFKCCEETYMKVGEPKRIEEDLLFTFEDLDGNTEYTVKIYAETKDGAEGKPVPSNKTKTAPNKPVFKDVKCFGPQNILVEWKSDPGCESHEVSISSKDQIESQFIVYNEHLRYFCLNEGIRYYVEVSSKNSSGYYGGKDSTKIDLEPRKLEGVVAKLEGNQIRITCDKPKQTTCACFMNAFIAKKKVTPKPQMGEHKVKLIQETLSKESQRPIEIKKDVIEWLYSPDENACAYTFELWAKTTWEIDGKKAVTAPIMSRPKKMELVEVKLVNSSPSTDIEISWRKQPQCDSYEVQVYLGDMNQEVKVPEAVLKVSQKTTVVYKCLSPGNTYSASVRAICQSTYGEPSEPHLITLAPVRVQIIEDSPSKDVHTPVVESVHIEWHPLAITPEHYSLQLYCDGEKVGEPIQKFPADKMQHIFKKDLKPGCLCSCTVKAFNGGQYGEPTKSKMYRIEWANPDFFTVRRGDNDPKTKAEVQWTCPNGVTVFRLEIEHHQKCETKTFELLSPQTNFKFDSALPGNSYTMRLYCGCDNKYSEFYSEDTITMQPNPPANVTVVPNNDGKSLDITITDTETAKKSYEVCVRSALHPKFQRLETITKNKVTLEDLTPGAKYEISVTTIIDEMRSEAAVSSYFTYPQEVKNLHASFASGKIMYEWDELEVKPDKYIVEWKVNNGIVRKEIAEMASFVIDHINNLTNSDEKENGHVKNQQKAPATKTSDTYSLRVAASNQSGCSAMTSWTNYVLTVPGKVQGLWSTMANGNIEFKWGVPRNRPDQYIVQWRLDNGEVVEETLDEPPFRICHHKPGQVYAVCVMGLNEVGRGPMSVWETFTTVPEEVKDLKSKFKNNCIEFNWNASNKNADQYIVQWKVDNEQIREEILKEPPFKICRYKPAHVYDVRIIASNAAGRGPMTSWETFTTDPLPPTDVCVKKDKDSPKTALYVTFKDEKDNQKSYIVSAWNDSSNEKSACTITTEEHFAKLDKLDPGQYYSITVETMFRDKKSKQAISVKQKRTRPQSGLLNKFSRRRQAFSAPKTVDHDKSVNVEEGSYVEKD